MASTNAKARAARVLRDARFSVEDIQDLLSAGQSTVYDWLEREPREVKASVREALEREIEEREEVDDTSLLAAARVTASKLDQLALSTGQGDAQAFPALLKEYRSLVNVILGASESDREWLLAVFAPVGHSPQSES